jgi:spermidine/putrescine transport system substrate-binding protein
VAFTQFVPVLSDITEELAKVDAAAAANPLINPSPEVQANLKSWAALTDEQTQEFNTLYAAVTGG